MFPFMYIIVELRFNMFKYNKLCMTKNLIAHLRWVSFIWYKLYFNKVIFKIIYSSNKGNIRLSMN